MGLVRDSKNLKFPIGSRVIAQQGWSDYCITNLGQSEKALTDAVYLIHDLKRTVKHHSTWSSRISGSNSVFSLFLRYVSPKLVKLLSSLELTVGWYGRLDGQLDQWRLPSNKLRDRMKKLTEKYKWY